MTERTVDIVRFHFDPLCPWCYQTSRWALTLERAGAVRLTWGVFSLERNNFPAEKGTFDPARARAFPALRVAVALRDRVGQDACGAFYEAIGERYFQREQELSDPAVLTAALSDAGLDPAWLERATGDAATLDTVMAEHEEVVEATKAFGVPFLRLDDGAGPSIFGPVISNPPEDPAEAVELWTHVAWLMRNEQFNELKRGERAHQPDLPYWRTFLANWKR